MGACIYIYMNAYVCTWCVHEFRNNRMHFLEGCNPDNYSTGYRERRKTADVRSHTHHNGVVVCTLKPQHDSGLSIRPAGRYPELTIVPHPANIVPQTDILGDVIEAGGHGHHDSVSSLQVRSIEGFPVYVVAMSTL